MEVIDDVAELMVKAYRRGFEDAAKVLASTSESLDTTELLEVFKSIVKKK